MCRWHIWGPRARWPCGRRWVACAARRAGGPARGGGLLTMSTRLLARSASLASIQAAGRGITGGRGHWLKRVGIAIAQGLAGPLASARTPLAVLESCMLRPPAPAHDGPPDIVRRACRARCGAPGISQKARVRGSSTGTPSTANLRRAGRRRRHVAVGARAACGAQAGAARDARRGRSTPPAADSPECRQERGGAALHRAPPYARAPARPRAPRAPRRPPSAHLPIPVSYALRVSIRTVSFSSS